MIYNIVGDLLLLSDYRLDRWLLRYSQKSGNGSGGGGVSGNSGSLLITQKSTHSPKKCPLDLAYSFTVSPPMNGIFE